MGYEFICGIPMAVVATLVIVFGLSNTLERLEERMAMLINKHQRSSIREKQFGAPSSGAGEIKGTLPSHQSNSLDV